jgi:uncharacterized protein YgfB (UPF0149 family)
MSDLKYNGWRNYETWLVGVHLGNHPELYERLMSIVQNPDSVMSQADTLSDWVRIDRDAQPEDIELSGGMVGMYTDLVCAALDAVDWRSIIMAHQEE